MYSLARFTGPSLSGSWRGEFHLAHFLASSSNTTTQTQMAEMELGPPQAPQLTPPTPLRADTAWLYGGASSRSHTFSPATQTPHAEHQIAGTELTRQCNRITFYPSYLFAGKDYG